MVKHDKNTGDHIVFCSTCGKPNDPRAMSKFHFQGECKEMKEATLLQWGQDPSGTPWCKEWRTYLPKRQKLNKSGGRYQHRLIPMSDEQTKDKIAKINERIENVEKELLILTQLENDGEKLEELKEEQYQLMSMRSRLSAKLHLGTP